MPWEEEDAEMNLAAVLAASLAVVGAEAPAQTPTPPAAAAGVSPVIVVSATPPAGPVYAPAKAADQKDDQFVCKTEAVLGSRLPVRRCRTVHDMNDRAREDREMVDRAQSNLQIRSR